MVTRSAMLVLMLMLLVLGACSPDLVDDTSTVATPRLLAVQASPAEAAPGQTVTLTALYADPDGAPGAATLDWAFCTARKPFSEAGPVDPACLVATSDLLVPLGSGASVTGTLPADGCRLFGPDRPTPLPGEPAGRPADADDTGGYFQPLRVQSNGSAGEAFALAQVRLRCNLPGATQAQTIEFQTRRRPNTNPTLEVLSVSGASGETLLVPLEEDAAASTTVPAGQELNLVAWWPGCGLGERPDSCGGAEAYVWFDPVTRTLVTRHEAMRVSWFASSGRFASGHTGRAEAESTVSSTNVAYVTPAAGTDVRLWAVLRDDRGGATWKSYLLRTE